MAKKILEEINKEAVMNSRWPTGHPAAAEGSNKGRRECWTQAAPAVANNTSKWSHGDKHGDGSGISGTTSIQHKPGHGNRGGRRYGRGGYGRRPY